MAIAEMTLAHLNFIVHEMDDAQWAGIACLYEDKSKDSYTALMYSIPGPKICIMHEGEVYVVGGVTMDGNGRGTIWMCHRRGWLKYLKETIKACRLVIDKSGLRHIKALVLASSKQNVNFIEHLGLKRVGLDAGLGDNGEDFYIYTAVRGEQNEAPT